MARWVNTIKVLIVQTDLKLNASPRPRGLVALTLIAGVSLAHLWLLAAAPVEVMMAVPGPALRASAVLHSPASVATPNAAPPMQPNQAAPRPRSTALVSRPDSARAARPSAEAAIASLPATASPPSPDMAAVPPVEPLPIAQANPDSGSTAQAPAGPAAPESNAGAATQPGQPSPDNAAPLPTQPAADGMPEPAPPATQLALSIPNSVRLNYQITGRARGFEYTASGQLDWQHDGQRYQSRVVISSFPWPSRSQTSVGELGPEGLSPRRFSDRSRSEVAIHFQPDQSRIVFSNNSPQALWRAGTQDRLSLLLQLAALIGGEPSRFEPGARISIPTTSLRDVELWEFAVLRKENLSLPIGEHPALLLRREPRHTYDQTLELWFAPTLGYLPVRMTISQANGDRLDQRLASIEKP